jgi:hypothetical protein
MKIWSMSKEASMAAITILGKAIPISFEGDISAADRDRISDALVEMTALIDMKRPWDPRYAAAYTGLKGIVFFAGEILVNQHLMSRPCCDEDDAIFYWEVAEFLQNMEPDLHAHTLFHDCWHVVQYNQTHRFAKPGNEQIEREVDAITHQIAVAEHLGAKQYEIDFLRSFCNAQSLGLRIAEGVDDGKGLATGKQVRMAARDNRAVATA